MLQVLPTNHDLLRSQAELPEDLRQNAVLLTFSKPIPRAFIGEFMRIHLTENMLGGGESGFFNVELYKPSAPRICKACNAVLKPVGLYRGVCERPNCTLRGKEHNWQPSRGVVRVMTFDDWIVMEGERKLAKRCLLVLDRRYAEPVLAAVKRTAWELGQDYGWTIG